MLTAQPGTTIHAFPARCSVCSVTLVYEVLAPDGARVDAKAVSVRDVVCPAHQSEEKLETMAEDAPCVLGGGGPCQVCGDKISHLVGLPPRHTGTVDFGRQLHGACAVPGVKKAG